MEAAARSPLTGFVALLRAAGLPVGADRWLLAHQALALVGLRRRAGLHAALRATVVSAPQDLPLFDAAFSLYWCAPQASLATLLPELPPLAHLRPRRAPPPAPPRRLLDALLPPHAWRPLDEPPTPVCLGACAAEAQAGAQQRFDELGAAEAPQLRAAARELARRLQQRRQRGRRWQASALGRVDLVAALRRLQGGRPLLPLARRKPRRPPQQCLWLGDVSGSMQEPVRALLLWAHALAQQPVAGLQMRFWAFGTRLHALSALLRDARDADAALAHLADSGLGRSGGTRIGSALQQLRAQEGPRLAAGRCTLLLVSDGLDHHPDDPLLADELRAWRARGVHLVWLDPLRRDHLDASTALARGVHARWPIATLTELQRFVEGFTPAHSGA